MKKLLLPLLFLLSLFLTPSAKAQTAISGNTITITGSSISANTFVRFRLRNYSGTQPRVGSSGTLAQTQFDCSTTSSGCVLSSLGILSGTIEGDDVITPVGTYYTVEIWNNGKTVSSADYLITGPTWNLNTATPITSYPNNPPNVVVLQNPTGVQNIVQPLGDPLELNGLPIVAISGSITPNDCAKWITALLIGDAGAPCGAGGGGGTPGGNDTDIQINHTSSSFAGFSSFMLDSSTAPTQLYVGLDLNLKGPNPVGVDVRQFGARAINTASSYQTTATISSSSNSASLTATSIFQNGDGVRLDGAGLACTLSTPVAPTVVAGVIESPSLLSPTVAPASAGSSSYQYALVARDKPGCRTAAGTTTTYSTGPAALGSIVVNVSTLSRANDVISVATSSATVLSPGAAVHLSGSTDASFSGWYNVSTVTDSQHFTIANIGLDTRAGATTSATGGTVAYFLANKLTWTVSTNGTGGDAWEYYIYAKRPGDASLHLVSVSEPTESASGYIVTQYDDFGTMSDNPNLPNWLSSSAPVAAVADPLVTTITSGGGTLSLTLNNNANTSVTNAEIEFDDAPAILSAANYAATVDNACVYFPVNTVSAGNFFISNTYLLLPNGVHYCNGFGILLNDTMETGSIWNGVNGGTSGAQFQFGTFPTIEIGTASPGVYAKNNAHFFHLSFLGLNNGTLMLSDDANNSTWDYDNFTTGGGSTDLVGTALVVRSAGNGFNYDFSHILFSGGFGAADSSWFPLLYMPLGQNGSDHVGTWQLSFGQFVSRGITQEGGTNSKLMQIYSQELGTPLLSAVGMSSDGLFTEISNYTPDTTTAPAVAALLAGGTLNGQITISANGGNSQEAGGIPGLISGVRIPDVKVFDSPANITQTGQNRNLFHVNYCIGDFPTFGYSLAQCMNFNSNMRVQPPYTLFWALNPPGGVSASFTSGGSVGTGAHTYAVTSVGFNGGESMTSLTSTATASGGTQTLNVTWTASASAASYTVYDISLGTAVTGCIAISTTSCVVASYGCCTNSIPGASGTGSTAIDAGQVISPKFVVLSALNGNPVSFSDTVQDAAISANRTLTLPDLNGVVQALTTITSYSLNHTLNTQDTTVEVTGTTTITVPHALPSTGIPQRWWVINNDVHIITLQCDSGNINGVASVTLASSGSVNVTADGTNCWAH